MKKQIIKHFQQRRWGIAFMLATVTLTLLSVQASALGGRSLSGISAGRNWANYGLNQGASYGGPAAAGAIDTYARPWTNFGLSAGQGGLGQGFGQGLGQGALGQGFGQGLGQGGLGQGVGQNGANFGLNQGQNWANYGLNQGASYGGPAAAGAIDTYARPWTNFGLNTGRMFSGGWF